MKLHRCRNTHDVKAYLAAKPRDIRLPTPDTYQDTPPYVTLDEDKSMVDADHPSVNWDVKCPVFETRGECTTGFKCRFLGGHVRKGDDGELSLIVDEDKKARTAVSEVEVNFIDGDALKKIRSKKV